MSTSPTTSHNLFSPSQSHLPQLHTQNNNNLFLPLHHHPSSSVMTKASTKLAAKPFSNISSSRNKQINFYRTYSLNDVVYRSRSLEDEWIDLDLDYVFNHIGEDEWIDLDLL
ncbi:hypothetical protein QL285_081767 [Trifolium repens]|nr:hypothetical protein QL285_081767 [Trifolium repens]